jgi:hypothetical protein
VSTGIRFVKVAHSHGVFIFLTSAEMPNPLPLPKRLPSGGPASQQEFEVLVKGDPRDFPMTAPGAVATLVAEELAGNFRGLRGHGRNETYSKGQFWGVSGSVPGSTVAQSRPKTIPRVVRIGPSSRSESVILSSGRYPPRPVSLSLQTPVAHHGRGNGSVCLVAQAS